MFSNQKIKVQQKVDNFWVRFKGAESSRMFYLSSQFETRKSRWAWHTIGPRTESPVGWCRLRVVGREGRRVTVRTLGAPLATWEGRTGGKGTFQGRTAASEGGRLQQSLTNFCSASLLRLWTSRKSYQCVNCIEILEFRWSYQRNS